MKVPETMIAFVLLLLTSLCADGKFLRNYDNYLSDDDMQERQNCPITTSCPNGIPSCSSSLGCPTGQKCCIDIPLSRACCQVTAAASTVTVATIPVTIPTGITTNMCPVGIDSYTDCASLDGSCSNEQDCFSNEICCILRTEIPYQCCINSTRPGFY